MQKTLLIGLIGAVVLSAAAWVKIKDLGKPAQMETSPVSAVTDETNTAAPAELIPGNGNGNAKMESLPSPAEHLANATTKPETAKTTKPANTSIASPAKGLAKTQPADKSSQTPAGNGNGVAKAGIDSPAKHIAEGTKTPQPVKPIPASKVKPQPIKPVATATKPATGEPTFQPGDPETKPTKVKPAQPAAIIASKTPAGHDETTTASKTPKPVEPIKPAKSTTASPKPVKLTDTQAVAKVKSVRPVKDDTKVAKANKPDAGWENEWLTVLDKDKKTPKATSPKTGSTAKVEPKPVIPETKPAPQPVAPPVAQKETNTQFTAEKNVAPKNTDWFRFVDQSLEGYGGGLITPKAYLLNPGLTGKNVSAQPFGMPTVSARFMKLGSKDIESIAISETLFGRIELSYAATRFGLGSLKDDFRKKAGVDIVRNDLYLHTFSVRGLLIEEDSFGLPLPAVTAGVHFKYNDSIQTIDRRAGRAIRNIGLERSNGVDYTLTMSKTLPVFERPLTVSGGLRFSQASQMGLFGFADAYRLTFEGNVSYSPTDWLIVGYEFRQKKTPYDKWDKVLGKEDNWHAITASVKINENMHITGAYGMFGTMGNSSADGTWSLSMTWKF